MTQTQLPRRPWAQLPPPEGGLDEVRRDARTRRRRRVVVVAALGSGVATTATVLAVLGGSGDLAVLKTNVPPASQPSPAVSRGTGVAAPPVQPAHAGQRGGVRLGAQPAQPGSGAGAGVDAAGNGPAAVGGAAARSDRGPAMTRYQSKGTKPNVCESGSVDNNNNLYGRVDWCLSAVATAVSGGTQLTVNLCRDSTGSGTLSFATTNEADITVQRNGKTVWDWARNHPARSSSHTLAVPSGDCWNWAVVWPDITQSGASAGTGTFTFVATSNAQQLASYPTDSATFTV